MRPTSSGGGRIKAMISVLFIAGVVFAGIKIIPVYVNNYELTDYIQQQNPFWLTQRASSDAVRDAILVKARDLNLPVRPEQVTVDASGARVTVSVDYTVPINLLVYTFNKRFQISAENRQL